MNRALIAAVFALSAMAVHGTGESAATSKSACGSETAESRLKDAPNAMPFFEKLRKVVERNDRNAAAEMVHFPLRVNGQYRVANRREFLRMYDRVFDTKYVKQLSSNAPNVYSVIGKVSWLGMAMSGLSTR